MFWINLLIWAVATVAFEIIRPKPKFEDARPSSLGDFTFPTATEGRPVPLVWGRVKIRGPNVIWYGDFRKQAVSENVSTGLFSSEDVITAYRYYVGLQFALCLGQVDALHEVWINEKSIYSGTLAHGASAGVVNTDLFGGEEHGQGGVYGAITFYDGRSDQAIDPYLVAQQDPAPAYRGVAYVVWDVDDSQELFAVPDVDWIRDDIQSPYQGWLGNSSTIAPWAFEVSRIPDGLNLAASDPGAEEPNPGDCNPMNVLYEILTDTDWGLSISPAEIDVTNFREAASELATEGNGFSMLLERETQITEIIDEVQRQIDGALFFDRAQGQWKVRLARADYTPATLTTLDETNVLELKEFTRQTWEETVNQVRVQFVDRDDSYKETYAFAQDMANMDIQGQTVQSDVRYPGCKDPDLANRLAWRDLKALSYPLAKAKLTVNRGLWNAAPGSLFKMSWDRLGISELVMRVSRINYGNPGDSKITIDAIQDIFAADAAVYGAPIGTGWETPDQAPEAPTVGESLVFEAPRQMVIQDPWDPNRHVRAWMGAQYPGGNTMLLQSYTRAGSSQPITRDYQADATISAFTPTATLDSDLDAYGASATRPAADYTITVTVESGSLGQAVIDGDEQVVEDLSSIVYVNGEFIGFEKCEDLGGGQYRLSRLYRGLFNSAPAYHTVSSRVWFIALGGNLSRLLMFSSWDEMDIQLRGVSGSGQETTEAGTPELELTFERIIFAPLAPRDPVLNSAYADESVILDTQFAAETGRTGADAAALETQVTARDWHVDNPIEDATTTTEWVDDSPEFDFLLILDPGGLDIEVGPYTIDDLDDEPTAYLLRNDIILAVGENASIPTTGRLEVTARHTYNGTTYTCPDTMEFDLTAISSTLQSADDLVHGAVSSGTPSVVTYGETGTYTFDIKTALPSSGTLEGRLNGGAWTTIVTAGNSSGTLPVSSGDDVELRWQTAGPAGNQFFDITGPTSELGYGVLTP